jgi:hypothetical protein
LDIIVKGFFIHLFLYMSPMFNVVNVLLDTFLYNSWFLSSLSQCSDFCCDPMPGTKGSCVVAGWQCLQFHWLQALWPCSLRPHSGQSLLQSMLITYLSIHLLSENVIHRINSRQLQRNTPCAPHCCLLFVAQCQQHSDDLSVFFILLLLAKQIWPPEGWGPVQNQQP